MDVRKIEVMWKNEVSAVVNIDSKDPNKVTVEYFTDNPIRYLIPRVPVNRYRLMEALESRCWPRDRANIEEILKKLGLNGYDIIGMCRITHGMKYDDYLWLRFDDEEIQYDDIKIRE